MAERDDDASSLVAAYLEDTLDADRARALARHLAAAPGAVDELARQAFVQAALRQVGRAPLDRDAVMARLPRRGAAVERAVMAYVRGAAHVPAMVGRRVRLWWLGWATAAVVAVLAVIVARPRTGPPAAAPTRIARQPVSVTVPSASPAEVRPASTPAAPVLRGHSGRVLATTRAGLLPVAAGVPLEAGAGLVTVGVDSGATVDLAGGGRVVLGADAIALRVGAPPDAAEGEPELVLARGRTDLEVLRPDRRPLTVAVPGGTVTTNRARLRVLASGGGARIDVVEGQARLRPRSPDRESDLVAGQFAQLAEDGDASVGVRPDGPIALLIAHRRLLLPSDRALETRLRELGFHVAVTTPPTMQLDQARDAAVVVVSSTIAPEDLDANLRDLPVPLVTMEVGVLPLLGMTEPCEQEGCGWTRDGGRQLTIDVREPAHPLAAGLTGAVTVADLHGSGWGSPQAGATVVATTADKAPRAVIFAHERGDAMIAGASAPARRVAFAIFFVERAGVERVASDSPAWKLFDEAVRWAAGRR